MDCYLKGVFKTAIIEWEGREGENGRRAENVKLMAMLDLGLAQITKSPLAPLLAASQDIPLYNVRSSPLSNVSARQLCVQQNSSAMLQSVDGGNRDGDGPLQGRRISNPDPETLLPILLQPVKDVIGCNSVALCAYGKQETVTGGSLRVKQVKSRRETDTELTHSIILGQVVILGSGPIKYGIPNLV